MRVRLAKAGMLQMRILFFLFVSVGQVHADGTDIQYKTYGSYTYCVEEGGTVKIVGYTGNEKVVNIPSEIDGMPVRTIAGLGEYVSGDYKTYYVNDKTRKIIVPEGVVSIESFNNGYVGGCMCVEEIILPDSVMEIDKEAFEYCEELKKIRLPSGLKEIKWGTFASCKSLKTIQLPNGLERIGASAFDCCYSLREIRIPDTVTSVGGSAFFCCKNLEKVTLSKNMTVIHKNTFAHCSKLKSIQIPKKVRTIGKRAFVNTAITRVTIPENVTRIERLAFWSYKTKLKKVTIKSTKLKEIGTEAFSPKNGAVYDVPDKCIKKYKKMLIKQKCFTKGKTKIK
ncbi:MAG: leucine-rich repeat domain-containing protein [Lachnospiraceae bacterium]|nr:leucine-rich repeat domain-containing protein [Lachnospiraceae bacterium]